MLSHVKIIRSNGLPSYLRDRLAELRRAHGWTQAELGQQVGLPQVHISDIETGKVVPRFTTLLNLVRVLDYDLLLVPRSLVPAVQALVRAHRQPGLGGDSDEGERPLYATTDETEDAP